MKVKPVALVLMYFMAFTPLRLHGGYVIPTVIYSTSEHRKKTLYLSREELQRIFTRKTSRWGNGGEIRVYIKPMGSIEHRSFLSEVLCMTLYRYQKSLEVNTNTAGAITVVEVRTDAEMRAAVYSHPGAIGYLNYTNPDEDRH